MLDRFKRTIDYLRVSVTDRCNLRCGYCMPPRGVTLIPQEKILSYEEIVEIVKIAVELGIRKVRLTGGEPLIRQDIVDLVAMLGKIKEIDDFAMTTNGVVLDVFAERLKKAGLHRVNISLDTLSPSRYEELTCGGDIRRVLAGIESAKQAELTPIKLNCVVKESSDEPDAQEVARFAQDNELIVRFIREMDIAKGEFWIVEGGTGGDCKLCNRLRLTSDGMIKPCLFSDIAFNVREFGIEEAITQAIDFKPESGAKSKDHRFYRIGG